MISDHDPRFQDLLHHASALALSIVPEVMGPQNPLKTYVPPSTELTQASIIWFFRV